MPEYLIAEGQGFGGGGNIRDAPNLLAPDECLALLNMVLDERGAASKRRGSTSKASIAARIISMHTFYRIGSDPQVISHWSDGSLRYSTDDCVNWTTIVTGLDTDAPFSFEVFNEKIYMSNGVDDYSSWDGTTFTTYSGAPKGKFLVLWKDAMWVAGVTGNEDRLYGSDPGDAEAFDALSFVDVSKGDGDECTGLGTDGTFLVFFKRRTHSVVYDPVTFANRVIDFEKGCESHFSIIQHEEQLYFFSRRGVCVFLGDAPSKIISDKFDPFFTPEVMNLAQLNKVWAYTHENRIGWTIPEVNGSEPSVQIEYYPRLEKKPMSFHRMPMRCATTVRKGVAENLFYGKTTGNKALEAFRGGTDDGTAFKGVLECAWFDLGNPIRSKYLRQVHLIGRGKFLVGIKRNFENAVSKTFVIDLSSTQEIWDGPGDVWDGPGDVWGPASVIQTERIHPDLYAQWISFRFEDAEITEGTKTFDVGDQDYLLTAGEWGIYGFLVHGTLMGENL